jgi:hypothetical protein
VLGANGRDTVKTELDRQNIEGSEDMAPSAIEGEAKGAGLSASVELPTCDVAGMAIDDGERARCFASYMRIHALEAIGGCTYSEMGRFEAKPGTPKSELATGGGTDNEEYAAKDPKTGKPTDNAARET